MCRSSDQRSAFCNEEYAKYVCEISKFGEGYQNAIKKWLVTVTQQNIGWVKKKPP